MIEDRKTRVNSPCHFSNSTCSDPAGLCVRFKGGGEEETRRGSFFLSRFFLFKVKLLNNPKIVSLFGFR